MSPGIAARGTTTTPAALATVAASSAPSAGTTVPWVPSASMSCWSTPSSSGELPRICRARTSPATRTKAGRSRRTSEPMRSATLSALWTHLFSVLCWYRWCAQPPPWNLWIWKLSPSTSSSISGRPASEATEMSAPTRSVTTTMCGTRPGSCRRIGMSSGVGADDERAAPQRADLPALVGLEQPAADRLDHHLRRALVGELLGDGTDPQLDLRVGVLGGVRDVGAHRGVGP